MKKRVFLIAGIVLLIAGVLFMFKLFGKKPRPEAGGKVNHTNIFAPKEIKSKNITGFNFSFYLLYDDPGDDDYTGFYHFKIENGVLSEDHWNISEPIDSSVTAKIQQIIEKYNLVKQNGKDVHTAGLPEEYQPFYFTAHYDSNEELYFSENNNPRSPWAKEIFSLLRQTFIDLGHSELAPSEEAQVIANFRIDFNIGEKSYEFTPIQMSDDENDLHLLRETEILGQNDTHAAEMSDLDDQFFAQLSELVIRQNLARFHDGRSAFGDDCPHTAAGYFEIYIDFANGKQIYGYSADPDKVADFQKDAAEIAELFDTYMQTHGIHPHEW